MGWHELAFAFTDIPQLFQRNDDDMYDRLSHRWTSAQLILFALLTTTTTYVGDPIHCWVPSHFDEAEGWDKYTNNYCWIRNTYYLPFDEDIPKMIPQRRKREIVYYQWVPIILMAQALMFYFPIVIWRTLNDRTGADMNDVIETAEKVQSAVDQESRAKRLYLLSRQTHRYLSVAKRPPKYRCTPRWLLSHCFCVCCGEHYGNYVTCLYVFIKVTFLCNAIGQMFFLNIILGMNFTNYGIHVIQSAINGEDWMMSERFPRVTMCDMVIRRLGNNNRYTVQCVLTINFFNEKIYLYLWCWFWVVALFTLYGLVLLLIRILFRPDTRNYVKEHLSLGGCWNRDWDAESELFEDFVYQYLRQDGMLLMRLVGHNTNKATVTDLICSLWEIYENLPRDRKRLMDAADEDDSDMDNPIDNPS